VVGQPLLEGDPLVVVGVEALEDAVDFLRSVRFATEILPPLLDLFNIDLAVAVLIEEL